MFIPDGFKVGEYIVMLNTTLHSSNCVKKDYCFRQRIDKDYICPVTDLDGSGENGNTSLTFDKKHELLDWRYATPEEIVEYERLGKPYNVKTLNAIPSRVSFYVNYTSEFTEDIYRAAMLWAVKNSRGIPRGMNDSYYGLQSHKMFIFDNWGLNRSTYEPHGIGKYGSYGVDNNRQKCEKEISVSDLIKLIGYQQIIEPNNKTKTELFGVETYVVFIKKYGSSNVGDIDKITESPDIPFKTAMVCEKEKTTTSEKEYVTWFATYDEANGFSQRLIENKNKGKQIFKSDEYIVQLYTNSTDGFNCCYVYKQREDCGYLQPVITANGHSSNGWMLIKKEDTSTWRYATPEEIVEYERLGKPYDVTTLNAMKNKIPDYVLSLSNYGNCKQGVIYKTTTGRIDILNYLTWDEVLFDYKRLEDKTFEISTEQEYQKQQTLIQHSLRPTNLCVEIPEPPSIRKDIVKERVTLLPLIEVKTRAII
jgi:hypothetical protein